MSNHSEEYLELVAEAKTLTKELTELSNKARIWAHDLAKSFADHPSGCVYCGETSNEA